MSRGIGTFQRMIMELLDKPWKSGDHRRLTARDIACWVCLPEDDDYREPTPTEIAKTQRALRSLVGRGLVVRMEATIWSEDGSERHQPGYLYASVKAIQLFPDGRSPHGRQEGRPMTRMGMPLIRVVSEGLRLLASNNLEIQLMGGLDPAKSLEIAVQLLNVGGEDTRGTVLAAVDAYIAQYSGNWGDGLD